jgi:hypothetical protein
MAYMVKTRSDMPLDDSDWPILSPKDSSLPLSLLGEKRCREPSPLLGVRTPDAAPEGSSGPVTETTGIGVSRFTNGSDFSLLMLLVFLDSVLLMRRCCGSQVAIERGSTATVLSICGETGLHMLASKILFKGNSMTAEFRSQYVNSNMLEVVVVKISSGEKRLTYIHDDVRFVVHHVQSTLARVMGHMWVVCDVHAGGPQPLFVCPARDA